MAAAPDMQSHFILECAAAGEFEHSAARHLTNFPVLQERGLCSAPELFSDAAMRNALRKIAAMQMKQEQAPPRSRGGSQAGSGRTSHRPSVDDEHQHVRANLCHSVRPG